MNHDAPMVASIHSAMVSRVLCQAYLQEMIFEIIQETWSIQCHVGIHVDFTSILHSHTPLVAQA